MKTPQVRAAHARWAERRRLAMKNGTWQPFMKAEPVRQHLRRVQAAGMPLRSVATKLGLPRDAFDHLLWGGDQHDPGMLVRRETGEAVLAYWPTLGDFPDTARIDPTGTRRRVEALETLGFTRLMVADAIGMPHKSFVRVLHADRVTARVARAVVRVYDQWWKRRPENFGTLAWVADRTRRAAIRKGYVGPLAWDDDTIDDPAAAPQTDALEPAPTQGPNVADRFLMGESVVLDREARRQVIVHLMQWTDLTSEQIGERLEMSADAVERTWHRIKAKAQQDGDRVPWRRVYLPKQSINRDEMESAA